VLELRRNPPLDDRLVAELVAMWAAVTNAGGAVGFVAPVTEDVVRPVAEAAFTRVAAEQEELVVGFDGERPVAFGFLTYNADTLSPHWATIRRLQRHPARRGGGVGARVLAELEAVAADRGLEFVVLTVRGGTAREHFYCEHGYRVVATLPRWLRLTDDDVRDSLVLVKPVGPGAAGRVDADVARLEVLRLDPGLPLPRYAHPGDAGLDLRARRDVTLAPGERAVVPTGVAVAVAPGCVGLVHPRSGLAARSGLALVNAPGTIDAGYRGEVSVVLVNLDPSEPIRLRRGDRIAQLLVQRVETVDVVEVTDLPPTARGPGGFGSTGR